MSGGCHLTTEDGVTYLVIGGRRRLATKTEVLLCREIERRQQALDAPLRASIEMVLDLLGPEQDCAQLAMALERQIHNWQGRAAQLAFEGFDHL